jgi:hypothetical protein
MKLKSWHLAAIVPVLIFGGIAVSAALNLWQTSAGKTPVAISEGEFAGRPDPGDIRGSYSLADIEAAFAVPADVLARAFGLAGLENPGAFQVMGLEELYGGLEGGEIGTDSVRLFTALYSGLPYTPEETTRLPAPAVAVLRQLGTVPEDRLAAAAALKPDIPASEEDAGAVDAGASAAGAAATDAGEAAAAGTHAAESSEERLVRGKTTFAELLDWGLSREEIEEALGLPMGPRGSALRDFLAEAGVEFSTVKTALQERVDAHR